MLELGQGLCLAEHVGGHFEHHEPAREVTLAGQEHAAERASAELVKQPEPFERRAGPGQPLQRLGEPFGDLGSGAVDVPEQVRMCGRSGQRFAPAAGAVVTADQGLRAVTGRRVRAVAVGRLRAGRCERAGGDAESALIHDSLLHVGTGLAGPR